MVSSIIFVVMFSLFQLPLNQAIRFKTQEVIASFDDLPSKELTFYKSLKWTSFSTAQDLHPIIPATSPTCVYSSMIPINVNDTIPHPDGRTATELTSIYPHSTVLFFDLQPFWFACLRIVSPAFATTDISIFEPHPCTLNISGYRAGSGTPDGGQKELAGAPTKKRGVEMVRANLLWNTFNAVQRVTFNVVRGGEDVEEEKGGATAEVVLVLDEVGYKTYNVTSWWGGVGVDSVVHDPGLYR